MIESGRYEWYTSKHACIVTGNVRNRTYSEDVDMRAQPPGTESGYNQILMQALEQHKRGDLNDAEYRRVISEVSSSSTVIVSC